MLDWDKKPSTINRSLISISSFCQWAQQNDLIPNNPAEGIRSVAEEPLAPRALERKEQLGLLRAVRRSGNLRDLAIITTCCCIPVCALVNFVICEFLILEYPHIVIWLQCGRARERNGVIRPIKLNCYRCSEGFYLKSLDDNEQITYIAGSKPERGAFSVLRAEANAADRSWCSPHCTEICV